MTRLASVDRTADVTTQDDNPKQSLRTRIDHGLHWLRQSVTEPQRNLDEVQRRVRDAFEIGRFCLRHLSQDRAPQMAASLAFRTLFGILPVLVVVTIAARSLLGDRFQDTSKQIIGALGLNEIKIIPPEIAGAANSDPVGLGEWVDGIVATASNIDLSALGWVGVAIVIFSAIWVMVTIENSFNVIYRARSGRSWTKRLLVYWCVLTFGPVMLGVMPWLSGQLSTLIATLPHWLWLATTIKVVSSIFMFWIFMFAVYMWVPNARVQFKPALIGAFVTAILLEIGKRSLGAYMQNAFSVSSLYGSLGLIPVFMFWMYLTWMFVLVGLEVSAILQALRGRDLRAMHDEDLGGLIDPAAILPVMSTISRAFEHGRALATEQVVVETGLRTAVVRTMLDRLERRGFLHHVERDDSFALARPPEQISAGELMDVAFELVDDTAYKVRTPMLERLREVQRGLAANTTLAGLTTPTETS
jgi:YihY family inner membrane protein